MYFCWADLGARDAEKQILRPAYPTSWGPKRAGSQDDTALGCQEQWTTGDVF